MEDAKPVSTPVNTSVKLTKAEENCETSYQGVYQSAVGSLLYLATWTRLDITFAVSNVATFCAKPTKEHWTAVKHILRYLKGTFDFGLLYDNENQGECIGFSDADWAGDLDDLQDTCSRCVGLQSAGEARNRRVWHCQPLRQNTWL